MLSDGTIRQINQQIVKEIRESDSWTNSPEERAAALDRAAKLKQLLTNEQPAPSCDENKIADLLVKKLTQPSRSEAPSPLMTILDALARR